ncbi:type I 3-dehydroquinate dehydratase [Lactococcus lactis]|uniref:3-dehydroquinate dehydratase n=2 Tax=Lactococcus lactis TaxID=1358 RepID=A0AAW7IYM8_9LACT|nr:type I 3-dehydroquinate dehydratase [Lactococcus lactis]KST89548.1 3-dehydroquinate dehydratase I [Lactococcus lactis subsp. lactis]MBU3884572.1 type I 3-dehydroquinate dehydratase [Lactococcus lactis]MCT0062309.1 type I 3-dehydroquinate dehydratase [Lactococcus lactis subsp. lactis]MCT0137021.1 type I 3-dehydroquinate dehydratase [Lactococcus lactis subsp. lactis]MCT3120564.1 type I 3-dehydroquinate dehydratase [Lactococcus lactis]
MRKTKIVVPIMLTELAELEKVSVSDYRTADIVEWRADFLSADEILEMAPKFFEKFKESKILFTLRTVREGGNIQVSEKKYLQILKEILTYNPAYIDVEFFTHGPSFAALKDFRDKMVLSYHNFDEVPSDLTKRLIKMHEEGTAFVKVAVMPERECDVLDLLQITRDMTLEYGEHFISMAMGDLGRLSRISGYLTGSCWTFASLENSSAPGQISLKETEYILDILEK